MVKQVNIHEAKTQLSKLLAQVARGEEVIIAKDNKPVAKLVRFQSPRERIPGSAKGKITIGEDFEAPLPEELLRAFEQ